MCLKQFEWHAIASLVQRLWLLKMRQACSNFLKLDFWVEKRSFQSGLWLPTLLILFLKKVYDQCFKCLCFSCFLRKVFANVVANVFKPQGRNCPLGLKASLQSCNCCSFYFWMGGHVPWNPSFLPSFFLPFFPSFLPLSPFLLSCLVMGKTEC